MLPTPDTRHVDTDTVYEPAEDSFLLLDTLSSDSETTFLHQRFNIDNDSSPPLVLEVGTGSGVVIAFLNANAEYIFGRRDILTLATDINPIACRDALRTGGKVFYGLGQSETEQHWHSGQWLTAINADLGSPLRAHATDVLIFNPPYVPSEHVPHTSDTSTTFMGETTTSEERSRLLSLSYEGGKEGMEVTSRLLDQLPHLLNEERGVAYILLCAQNNPHRVVDTIKSWGDAWSVDVVGRSGAQAGWERLQIIRISRRSERSSLGSQSS